MTEIKWHHFLVQILRELSILEAALIEITLFFHWLHGIFKNKGDNSGLYFCKYELLAVVECVWICHEDHTL